MMFHESIIPFDSERRQIFEYLFYQGGEKGILLDPCVNLLLNGIRNQRVLVKIAANLA